LVTQSVYNFTQNHKATRESVSVGVAYESDVNKVKQLLVDIALSHQLILAKPEPFVFFEDFGDSSLLFKVSFYTENSFLSNQIKSDLRFQIMNAFQKEGITIPFPQRDVHLISKKGEDV
jgi:small-conductance mechanosensitive channel